MVNDAGNTKGKRHRGHPEVLRWLEKLRDWQVKYNPITAPTPWTELELRHTRNPMSDASLKAMGSTCFLFRDAAAQGDDRFRPVVSNALGRLWYKLLRTLENECVANKVLDLAGNRLVFVRAETKVVTTYYPLHSLRVSLITAYALEGGVPMAILSKCIAGHARLIMTLYYTKAGITYCTETMDAATKRNHIQLQMGDVGERVAKLEGQLISLEDQQFECQENDLPFLEQDQLATLRKIYQAEVEKNNRHAEDFSATYRLIARCTTLAKGSQEGNGIQLVAVGALQDVHVAIDECTKLQQVLNPVAGSTVYPEHDVSKAVLQAGKAYDMMLARNGKEPVFFQLSEEELPAVVAHMTRLIATEAGSIKDALSFVEGARRLAELGLDLDLEALTREMAIGEVIQVGSAPRQVKSVNGRLRLSSPAKVLIQEISHGAK
jgi:hypothetical protein